MKQEERIPEIWLLHIRDVIKNTVLCIVKLECQIIFLHIVLKLKEKIKFILIHTQSKFATNY